LNNYTVSATQQHILDDLGVYLVRASAGQRLANLLIDLICFCLFWAIPGLLSPEFWTLFFIPLLPAVAFGIYMSLMEIAMKGKTIGKLVTGTRAVQVDGSPINSTIAWQRGFSRIVPFEAFSALGGDTHPWHDGWTGTVVVVEKDSRGI